MDENVHGCRDVELQALESRKDIARHVNRIKIMIFVKCKILMGI